MLGLIGGGGLGAILLGCGASTTLPVGDDEVGDCRVLDRFTLLEGDGLPVLLAAAAREDEIGLLWSNQDNGEPSARLLFSTLNSDFRLGERLELDGDTWATGNLSLMPKAEGFLAAWIDEDVDGDEDGDYAGVLYLSRIVTGEATRHDVGEGTFVPDNAGVSATERLEGSTAIAWGDLEPGGSQRLLFSIFDGDRFSDPTVLHEADRVGRVSMAATPDGVLGIAWAEGNGFHGFESVWFVSVDRAGSPGRPVRLHEGRWNLTVSIAFGAGRFGVAWAELGEIEPSFHLLDLDGGVLAEAKGTTGLESSGAWLAWDGESFNLAAVPQSGSRVLLRRFDDEGRARSAAVDLSTPTYVDDYFHANPRIVALPGGRNLVLWQANPSSSTSAIRSTLADCSR